MPRSAPSGVRAQAFVDVALIVWTATWLWMGIAVAHDSARTVGLLLHVPRRIALARERRALRRAVARGRTAELDRLLAERAVSHLPYQRLRLVSEDPYGDLRSGRLTALADAELAWFGVSAPAPGRQRMLR